MRAGRGTPRPREQELRESSPTSLGPQQTIPLTSRRVRPNMLLVSHPPPQGIDVKEEEERSAAAAGITRAQPFASEPVSTEYSDWSNCSPRKMIFARDWLAPLRKSCGEVELVARRLRASRREPGSV